MAINVNPGVPVRHVATYTGSGTFVTPAGRTLAFVALHGASGGGGGSAGTRYGGRYGLGGVGGQARISGAFVQVVPGGSHSVTVGAAGTAGFGTTTVNQAAQNGGAGGSTIFDSVFTQPGGSGGQGAYGDRYSATSGAAGAAAANGSGVTALTALSPSGALPRVGSITTQATGANNGGNGGTGRNDRYGTAPAGQVGTAGQVNIYI
jgi:hypothetical protein